MFSEQDGLCHSLWKHLLHYSTRVWSEDLFYHGYTFSVGHAKKSVTVAWSRAVFHRLLCQFVRLEVHESDVPRRKGGNSCVCTWKVWFYSSHTAHPKVLEEVHFSTQAAAAGSLHRHTRKQARKRHHICTRENADLLIQPHCTTQGKPSRCRSWILLTFKLVIGPAWAMVM